MTTKQSKKTAAPEVVEQNGASKFTPQPGQIVVMSETDILISAPWLNSGYLMNRAYGIRAGVPTIVPARVLEPRTDGWRMHDSWMFVVTEGVEGVMPEIVDASDSRERTIWSTGSPPLPDRGQMLENFRHKYIEYSLGEAVLKLIENGWSEQDAAAILIPEYESAFERRNGDVGRKSWVLLAETILKNQAAQAETDGR